MTMYEGSCHCGKIAYSVEGEITEAMECNCSHCSRKGYLLTFLPAEAMTLKTPRDGMKTYRFHKEVINHRFCPDCGCALFSEGESKGKKMVGINVRCIPALDKSKLTIKQIDGARF